MKPTHTRTIPQNSSGHAWFDLLAQSLNDAGYTLNSDEVLHMDRKFLEAINMLKDYYSF